MPSKSVSKASLPRQGCSSTMMDSSCSSIDSITQFVLDDIKVDSDFFFGDDNIPLPVPTFTPQEINLGFWLGSGDFGDVFEVVSFNTCSSLSTSATKETAAETSKAESSHSQVESIAVLPLMLENPLQRPDSEVETKARMIKYPFREGTTRYAVKRLKSSLANNKKLKSDAVVDLACEAEFLSRIIHPNIVRLRGIVGTPGSFNFMLLMDRLTLTLTDKIKDWSTQKKKTHKGFVFVRKDALATRILYEDRLLAAYDVARALKHLHSKRLIFRDLKPDNIGVDPRGEFRMFDFGLVRELKPKDLVQQPDGYNCTGCTGSRRYLAPEVIRCLPYGFSADVYSYGVLFWQMFALKTPYPNLDAAKHTDKVVVGGARPPHLKAVLSPNMHKMMTDCWSESTQHRPSFDAICKTISQELVILSEGNGLDLIDRSGYLLNLSRHSQANMQL